VCDWLVRAHECRSALEAVVAADVELMELRAEEADLLKKLENPDQQDEDVSAWESGKGPAL